MGELCLWILLTSERRCDAGVLRLYLVFVTLKLTSERRCDAQVLRLYLVFGYTETSGLFERA